MPFPINVQFPCSKEEWVPWHSYYALKDVPGRVASLMGAPTFHFPTFPKLAASLGQGARVICFLLSRAWNIAAGTAVIAECVIKRFLACEYVTAGNGEAEGQQGFSVLL